MRKLNSVLFAALAIVRAPNTGKGGGPAVMDPELAKKGGRALQAAKEDKERLKTQILALDDQLDILTAPFGTDLKGLDESPIGAQVAKVNEMKTEKAEQLHKLMEEIEDLMAKHLEQLEGDIKVLRLDMDGRTKGFKGDSDPFDFIKQLFAKSELVKSIQEMGATRREKANVSIPWDLGTGGFYEKAAGTSSGWYIEPQNDGILPILFKERHLMEFITVARTNSNAIKYTRHTMTNNAAGVAEGAAKPETTFTPTVVTETVKKIAHWNKETDEVLEDVPQWDSLIRGDLMEGLLDKVETQMFGGGGGNDLTGIYNIAGVQSRAFATNIITTSRKAITDVQVNGLKQPTAFMMHPTDCEAFDLVTTGGSGEYVMGGPKEGMTRRLWGLPIVPSLHATAGTPLVAYWKDIWAWIRREAAISITNTDQDDFIKNLVTFLAELRLAFGAKRPSSVCKFSMS